MYEKGIAAVLLSTASIMGAAALGLFWLSQRREPRPWRAGDFGHYERRTHERPGR